MCLTRFEINVSVFRPGYTIPIRPHFENTTSFSEKLFIANGILAHPTIGSEETMKEHGDLSLKDGAENRSPPPTDITAPLYF